MKLPIIMLSMSRWDGVFSSASFSLAKEFSKNSQVFYIDNPYTYKDYLKKFRLKEIKKREKALLSGKDIYTQIKDINDNFVAVTPPLLMPINWLPPGKFYDLFSKRNNLIINNIIRRIIKDFNLTDYIIFNSFNPFYFSELPRDISPKVFIYQSRDDISQSEYVNKHGVYLEKRAVKNSDIALGTSIELTKMLSTKDKKVHYLPNAADLSIFKKVLNLEDETPKELERFKEKRVIGYIGNICLRLDYDLLAKVAQQHPDKILLMIGPRNDKKHTSVDLDSFSNIVFIGPRNIHELPKYLKHIDVAIIPFKCNKLTKSIYPLKINEYLAGGKAVVSTKFSEDINAFDEVTYLANNHEEFISLINKAIEENSSIKIKERVEEAQNNTWESRIELFWSYVDIYLRNKSEIIKK